VFFPTRAPQGGFSCRFAAIHLLSSEKTIKIYFESATLFGAFLNKKEDFRPEVLFFDVSSA